MYLWRSVDAEGEVLDILVQRHRDCFRPLPEQLRSLGMPKRHLTGGRQIIELKIHTSLCDDESERSWGSRIRD